MPNEQQIATNSHSITCYQESVYSTGSLEDQEGSRGIEMWMRCPTPPISARLRQSESNGALDASSTPSRKGSVVPLDEFVEVFDDEAAGLTHDEHKDYLACPFWKHDPTRYIYVKNSCTEGVGFKDIGKLTEHIKRVHCLWNGCEKCRKRFNQCRMEEVDEEKRKHMANCTKPEKELTDSDAEWMNEVQDAEYRRLNFQRDKGNPSDSYRKICRALWGSDYQNAIPEPYHLPGFQLSVFRWRFMKRLEQLPQQKEPEESYQNMEVDTVTTTPVLMVQNHDPMLSQQALHHLSNATEPFYRGQHRKDSGVWSWDHSSENQLAFAKPTFLDAPYDDEEAEEHDQTPAQMESNYDAAGAWTNLPPLNECSQLELDRDFDENFT
ncbi:hypothetical protein F5Y13DRAFT_178982 [Hypoxylon sp. FL1857]|nr:hypothetical protein F5Y13DRAFT_178982 [Hypoxylon sp. FL1857]